MNRLTLSLPIALTAAGIIVASRILDGTPYSPWFPVFKAVETASLMGLFLLLGLFVSRYLRRARDARGLECMILSTAVCLLFAVANEWHQALDPGHRTDFPGLVRMMTMAVVGSVVYLAWAGARQFFARVAAPNAATAGHTVVAVPLAVLVTLAVVAYWDQPISVFRALIGQPKTTVRALGTMGSPEQRAPRPADLLPAANVGTPVPVAEPTETVRHTPSSPQVEPADSVEDVSQRIKGQLVQEALTYLAASGKSGGTEETLASVVTKFVTATNGQTPSSRGSSLRAPQQRADAGISRLQEQFAGPKKPSSQTSVPAAHFGHAPVAVIVNPSNPVGDLTVDQARKLLSGEYSNWSQLGGPDLAVTVLLVGHPKSTDASPERVLNVAPAREARRLKYVSFIFPHVDRNKGAVAFVPLTTMGQLDVLGQHDELKMVALKDAPGSTAVAPTQEAIRTGSYPMVAQQRLSDGR